jgi:hypothetical protein
MRWTLILVLFLGACTKWVPDDDLDAGGDARVDTGVDATLDASVDASVDAAGDAAPDAAIDAQVDAAPECTGNAQCANPEPICDVTDQECRMCNSQDTCGVGHPDTPVCFDGQCVVCATFTDCDAPDAPICDPGSHDCRECNADPECAARDADLPVCFEAAGTCVVCDQDNTALCVNPNPVCDLGLNDCRPCEAHVECPDLLAGVFGGVCDLDQGGVCLTESDVLFVDIDTSTAPGDGSAADPFAQIHEARAAVTSSRFVILVKAGTYERFEIQNRKAWVIGNEPGVIIRSSNVGEPVVKVLANSVTDVTWLKLENVTIQSAVSGAPGLACTGQATAHPDFFLLQTTVTNNAGGGLSASNCSVSIDRSNFSSNAGGGLSASNCSVSIDRSNFSSNAGGGLSLSTCDFSVTNSIFNQNGGTQAGYGAVSIMAPGNPSRFAFNTLVGNLTTGGNPAGVRCIDPVTLTSSLLFNNLNGNSVGCTLDHSWQGMPPTDNPNLDGSYHLTAASACCIDLGIAVTGVDHDTDGDPRSLGLAPDIGADERQ